MTAPSSSNSNSDALIAVEHNPMIYESDFRVCSIHRTLRGAARAMNALKGGRFNDELMLLESSLDCLDDDAEYIYEWTRINIIRRRGFEAFRYRRIVVKD